MNILDLYKADGFSCKKVAGTNGGEHHGPCPFCGGKDRFAIRPAKGNGGRYWCRPGKGCGKRGDLIQYLRDYRGMSYQDACRYIGKPLDNGNHRSRSPKKLSPVRHQWKPEPPTLPPALWSEKAGLFVEWAQEQLWSEAGRPTLEWLKTQRGLSEQTIQDFRLGWNQGWHNGIVDVRLRKPIWGLEEVMDDRGRVGRLWIPFGLVIPHSLKGKVCRLRIRRDGDLGLDEDRYIAVSGSKSKPLMVCGNGPRDVVMVVESELDAILLNQEAGDLAQFVALGSAQAKPDTETTRLLRRAKTILLSLDDDEAGKQAVGFWREHFKQSHRWPPIRGKDPGESFLAGVPLSKWVQAGVLEHPPSCSDTTDTDLLDFGSAPRQRSAG